MANDVKQQKPSEKLRIERITDPCPPSFAASDFGKAKDNSPPQLAKAKPLNPDSSHGLEG